MYSSIYLRTVHPLIHPPRKQQLYKSSKVVRIYFKIYISIFLLFKTLNKVIHSSILIHPQFSSIRFPLLIHPCIFPQIMFSCFQQFIHLSIYASFIPFSFLLPSIQLSSARRSQETINPSIHQTISRAGWRQNQSSPTSFILVQNIRRCCRIGFDCGLNGLIWY